MVRERTKWDALYVGIITFLWEGTVSAVAEKLITAASWQAPAKETDHKAWLARRTP